MQSTQLTLNDDGTITETRHIPALITLAEAAHMLELDSREDVFDLIANGHLVSTETDGITFVGSHDVVLLRADLWAARRAAMKGISAADLGLDLDIEIL